MKKSWTGHDELSIALAERKRLELEIEYGKLGAQEYLKEEARLAAEIDANGVYDELEDLKERVRECEKENAALSKQFRAFDSPLTSKERNTLLRVIAGLCVHGNLNIHQRGAATIMVQAVQQAGFQVSNATVGKILTQIRDLEG